MKKIKILLLEKEKKIPIDILIKLEELNFELIRLSFNIKDITNKIIEINPDLILFYFDRNYSMNIKTLQFFIRNFNTPVVYLIKDIEESVLEEIISLDAYGFIFEPFSKKALKLVISNALYKFKKKKNEKFTDEIRINDHVINVLQLQKNILPKQNERIDNIIFDWLFFPSYHGSGDIFNYFKLGDFHIGFYLLDVMGHGFESALTSTILHTYLFPDTSIGGIVKRAKNSGENNMRRRKEDFQTSVASPKEVLLELNNKFYSEASNSFFTIIYGTVNILSYEVKLARAGHHYPLYITKDSKLKVLESVGNAIGISDKIEIEEYKFIFEPGARLYLYSDGLVEYKDKGEREFSKEILFDFLKNNSRTPLKEAIGGLENQVLHWSEYEKLNDDIALLALERLS